MNPSYHLVRLIAATAYGVAFLILSALVARTFAFPCASEDGHEAPRLVLYFQTTHDSHGEPISLLPLITEQGSDLTHLIIASFHINEGSYIHLNDHLPSDPKFSSLWSDAEVMKAAGVKILGMVGGAAQGSFSGTTLDGNQSSFSLYYTQLRDVINKTKLQGLDLDVEERMSQSGITRLIRELRKDFGPEFLITMSPVAWALQSDVNPSGFSYRVLESEAGADIAFYNAQFYSGYGNIASPRDYEDIISHGWEPSKIVVGQLTSPLNGNGYTSIAELKQTVNALQSKYGSFGGVMGWEYYNSEPGGVEAPWQWARTVADII